MGTGVPMASSAEERLVDWDPAWALGIPHIDGQHQKLVSMIRELQEDARSPEIGSQTLLFVLFEILDYAVTHFTDEEALFMGKGWAGEAAHLAEHEAFLHRARAQLETFRTDGDAVREQTLAWLVGWLKAHILISDRAFAEHLQKIEAS